MARRRRDFQNDRASPQVRPPSSAVGRSHPLGLASWRHGVICSMRTAHRAARPQPTRDAPPLAQRTRMQAVWLRLLPRPCPPRSSIFAHRSQAARQAQCRAKKRHRTGGAASPVRCPCQFPRPLVLPVTTAWVEVASSSWDLSGERAVGHGLAPAGGRQPASGPRSQQSTHARGPAAGDQPRSGEKCRSGCDRPMNLPFLDGGDAVECVPTSSGGEVHGGPE